MRVKIDEENFEEAEAQAYRCWTTTGVPSEIAELFSDPNLSNLSAESPPFFHLLDALRQFSEQPPYTLPLSSTLPDMKANTSSYIDLQKLYKTRAEEEKAVFRSFLKFPVDDALVDLFVKNCHAIKILRGKKWGSFTKDPNDLGNLLHLTLTILVNHSFSKVLVGKSQACCNTSGFVCSSHLLR